MKLHTASSSPVMFTCPELAKSAHIKHGFFGREGGVSTGIYSFLNIGYGSKDDKALVRQNRTLVVGQLGATLEQLCAVYQTHSNKVVTVEKIWDQSQLPGGDAMVTNVPGIALGISTADCVPVLFADDTARVIGAAHSGWKGAIGGILENTVKSMQELGAKVENIKAAIGPSIQQKSYEVSSDFRDNFLNQDKGNEQFFIPASREAHFMFDLTGYVKGRLEKLGVGTITRLPHDTYSETEHFFSFRRTTHKQEEDYGRQISVIMLAD